LVKSFPIAKWSVEKGFEFCGTIRLNRKGVPKPHAFTAGKKSRGSTRIVSTSWIQERIYFIAWQDSKPVHMLTSFISKMIPIRSNSVNNEGEHELLDVMMPSSFKIYNKYMGGTDHMDQLIAYYRPRVKTYKWQVKVFVFFLTAAIANAHVLYKKFGMDSVIEAKKQPGYTLLDFIIMLIKELIGENLYKNAILNEGEETKSPETRVHRVQSPARVICHTPFKAYENSPQVQTRRRCAVCSVRRTLYICVECNIPLCVSNGDCWRNFHVNTC
jgi:hypothetical protein